MSGGAGAEDVDELFHVGQYNAVLAQDADLFNESFGALCVVGEGVFFDFSILAIGLANQAGRRVFSIWAAFDVPVLSMYKLRTSSTSSSQYIHGSKVRGTLIMQECD